MMRNRSEKPTCIVEVIIDNIGFEGIAVGRVDGMVHFVKGALPGEHVLAKVIRSNKRFIECEAVEIITPSQHRLQAPCPYFGVCGGCSWQHLEYDQQLFWKRKHVVDAFKRIGQTDDVPVLDIVRCNSPYSYRNKMEFSFGASRWLTVEEIASGIEFDTSFALGLHVPGRFDKIKDIGKCLLQSDYANILLNNVRELTDRHAVSAHNPRKHEGFLRNLVIRSSFTTSSILAILITTSVTTDVEREFVDEWMKLYPMLPMGSSVIHAINDSKSPVANGTIISQKGVGYLNERSHGVDYKISPFSFFQTNTIQMERLVDEALKAASVTSTDIVWDLYCGTGTLTLPVAKHSLKVIGFEIAESSINDAQVNRDINQINNVEFHVMDLHARQALEQLSKFEHPDVVIVDPPRNGMHPQVINHLLELRPSRISYVSCNPSTLARDCALLKVSYDINHVVPVDMFPQTFHIEAVARLSLRS